MSEASFDDFQTATQEAAQRLRLRRAYVRTGLGYVLLIASLCNGFLGTDGATSIVLAVVLGLAAIATLAGHTPRVLQSASRTPHISAHATPTYAKSVMRAANNRVPDIGKSQELARISTQLKALFLIRMLGIVGLLMVVVTLQWLGQRANRAAHFERFGTYEGVAVHVHLDGSETIIIDPSLSPGSYRQTIEQPPRAIPVAPTPPPTKPAPGSDAGPADVSPAATPEVDRTPIAPPKPTVAIVLAADHTRLQRDSL